MSIVEITFRARCKHCKFLKSSRMIKKDGTESWRNQYSCGNPESERSGNKISKTDYACDKLDF